MLQVLHTEKVAPTGPIVDTIYLSALPKEKINYFYGQKLESDWWVLPLIIPLIEIK